MSKARLKAKTRSIKTSLRKSGIKTLQDVLNTSILSSDAKIKYIRHTYTCYEHYMKTFYRNNEGISLRNELNAFLKKVVDGECGIEELKEFNHKLKEKLKIADENYIQEKKLFLEQNEDLFKSVQEKPDTLKDVLPEPCDVPDIPNLSEKEKECLKTIPFGYCKTNMTEAKKIKICMAYINSVRNTWKGVFKRRLSCHDINCYLVELYLDNRNKDFYPTNFTDLDFIKWSDIVKMAKVWLLEKFNGNKEKYNSFITITLPLWIENNANTHESKILQLL